MGRYSRTSIFENKSIRKIVASACYVEIAIAAGMVWNPVELERRVNRRKVGSYTGIYRKMIEGCIPNNTTCKRINRKLKKGRCNLFQWRDHPFWVLLSSTLSGIEYLHHFEGTMGINWPGMGYNMLEMGNHEFITTNSYRYWEEVDYDEIASDNISHAIETGIIFGVFAGHTAWAREAREYHLLQPMYQCGALTRKMFAKTVCNTPHLFIRWPLLAHMYKMLIWSAPSPHKNAPWFSTDWDNLMDEMAMEEKQARSNGVKLPPKHIFRQINKYN